jgi:hypothetical protein
MLSILVQKFLSIPLITSVKCTGMLLLFIILQNSYLLILSRALISYAFICYSLCSYIICWTNLNPVSSS